MRTMDSPRMSNRLLASLPGKVARRLISRSEETELTAGEILCTPGARLLHADFPLTGIISAQIPFDTNSCLQVELVGNEGMAASAGHCTLAHRPFEDPNVALRI